MGWLKDFLEQNRKLLYEKRVKSAESRLRSTKTRKRSHVGHLSVSASVNFVLNSVFVSLTELYFRFRLFSVFACIFVVVFVSFVYYRFRFLL